MRSLTITVIFLAVMTGVGIYAQQTAVGSSQSEPLLLASDEPEESPTPTPVPTPTPDPIIVKATQDKAIADAEKAASDAKKAAADAETAAIAARLAAERAKLGLGPTDAAATATPAAGNITPSTGAKFIETQVLADASARQATHQLVEQLCGPIAGFPTPSPTPAPVKALGLKPLKTLVINNGADRSSVEKFRSILAQVQFLDEEYQRLIKQAKNYRENLREKPEGPELAALPLLIPAATEMVKGAATLINLFRTDTEFQDQTVTVNSRTIVTLLTNKLLSASTGQCQVEAIFHPAIYPLSLSANAKDGSLIKAYRALLKDITDGDAEIVLDNQKISALTKRLAELKKEIADLNEKIKAHEKGEKEAAKKPSGSKKKKKEKEPPVDVAKLKSEVEEKESEKELIEEKLTKVKQAVAEIEAFKASLSDIFKLLTAVDDTTKLPLLANLIRAERLSDILANENTYALDLDVKASGTNRIRRNMFWNAKIAHSAGVSIDANLYNNEDKQVFGTIQPYYVEFTGSKQIRQQSGFRKLNEMKP